MRVTGPDADEFTVVSTCPGTVLRAGDSCTAAVAFAPAGAGARTATLDFDTDLGVQSVALSGTGTNSP